MSRSFAFWLIIAAIFVAGCASLVSQAMYDPPKAACMEDMPCWDCHTMGNRVCGPARYPAWEQPKKGVR